MQALNRCLHVCVCVQKRELTAWCTTRYIYNHSQVHFRRVYNHKNLNNKGVEKYITWVGDHQGYFAKFLFCFVFVLFRFVLFCFVFLFFFPLNTKTKHHTHTSK